MRDIPFTEGNMRSLIDQGHTTPFYVYDEKAIRTNAQRLYKTFSWMPKFKNYYAVKALPNPHILRILKEEGMGADCSSLGELIVADTVDLSGLSVILTSNNTPPEEFQKAEDVGAIVNFDDIAHLDMYQKTVGKYPDVVSFRYNPGPLKSGNEIIGEPEDAKFGITESQIFEAYRTAKIFGIERFGLHTMVCSNELGANYFLETVEILFSLAKRLHEEEGITFEFINIGGGLGIPYKPQEHAFAIDVLSDGIKTLYKKYITESKHPDVAIVMESGRYITGPYGYLVTSVRHLKTSYKHYVGLDACMANLMRPGMYDAYHHINNISNPAESDVMCDVVGSLCENNDKFAIDRMLPSSRRGDLLVITDAGAHAHSMGFQYNAKLRSAEFILKPDGSFMQIRRAETLEDYFSTLVNLD